MKKEYVVLLFVLIFGINLITAQQEALDAVPGGSIVKNIVDQDGNVVAAEKFDKFRKQNSSYLWAEWTKMPYVGPVLGALEKVISFFNPLWRYSFGMEFAWNIAFFLHVFIWSVIIITLYYPAKAMAENIVVAILLGIVVASITGSFGIISKVVDVIDTAFGKLWWLTLAVVIIIILLLVLEKKFFEASKKESKKEKLERADDLRMSAGEASKKMIEGMSKFGG